MTAEIEAKCWLLAYRKLLFCFKFIMLETNIEACVNLDAFWRRAARLLVHDGKSIIYFYCFPK